MPQVDFRQFFSGPDQNPPAGEFGPANQSSSTSVPANPYRAMSFGRPEWANLAFVAVTFLGGLTYALYFFGGGTEVFRTPRAWSREYLYQRPATPAAMETINTANRVANASSDTTSGLSSNRNSAKGTLANVGASNSNQTPLTSRNSDTFNSLPRGSNPNLRGSQSSPLGGASHDGSTGNAGKSATTSAGVQNAGRGRPGNGTKPPKKDKPNTGEKTKCSTEHSQNTPRAVAEKKPGQNPQRDSQNATSSESQRNHGSDKSINKSASPSAGHGNAFRNNSSQNFRAGGMGGGGFGGGRH